MKLFRTLLLTLSLISVVFHSNESKAAIGLVAAPAIISAGVVMTAVGAGGTLVLTKGDSTGWGLLFALFSTIPLALVGLVVLEGEQQVEFGPLTKAQAQQLAVTNAELKAYNNEVEQLNSLAAYVEEEIARDGEATVEESASVWNEVKSAVSAEAFNAFVKINKQMFKVK